MYAIKWTRKTGESGVYETRWRSKQAVANAACTLRLIDMQKGRKNEYEYEIIEI